MSGHGRSALTPDSTHLGPPRSVLARAEGCFVWDRDGRRFLDAASGSFCVNLGYSRPDLIGAMTRAAARLPYARPTSFDGEEAEAYRAELLAAAGPPFTRVVLTSSASEAVDAAMKIAIAYQRVVGEPRRTTIRSLAGHFHGATLGALGVTGWEERRAPWDDALGPRADGLPTPGDGSAGFIAETIPVAGLGVALPARGELARRRAACDEAGALWIADEALTGFWRTGSMFAWQGLDAAATPDLVVFGKAAGAGFIALAGVLVSARVADALESSGPDGGAAFSHQQTYGGSPIACAVGRAVLRAAHDEGLAARALSLGRELEGLLGAAMAAAGRKPPEGIGALWGIDAGDATNRERPIERAGEAVDAALERWREHSVLAFGARSAGRIVVAPPLTADAEALALIVTAARARLEAAGSPPTSSRGT